jgi:hypothetical protein
MALYHEINRLDEEVRADLWHLFIQTEAETDVLVLKIICEFNGLTEELKPCLTSLRQSVQSWRERLEKDEHLPLPDAQICEQARFQEAFAEIAACMVHHIHSSRS